MATCTSSASKGYLQALRADPSDYEQTKPNRHRLSAVQCSAVQNDIWRLCDQPVPEASTGHVAVIAAGTRVVSPAADHHRRAKRARQGAMRWACRAPRATARPKEVRCANLELGLRRQVRFSVGWQQDQVRKRWAANCESPIFSGGCGATNGRLSCARHCVFRQRH